MSLMGAPSGNGLGRGQCAAAAVAMAIAAVRISARSARRSAVNGTHGAVLANYRGGSVAWRSANERIRPATARGCSMCTAWAASGQTAVWQGAPSAAMRSATARYLASSAPAMNSAAVGSACSAFQSAGCRDTDSPRSAAASASGRCRRPAPQQRLEHRVTVQAAEQRRRVPAAQPRRERLLVAGRGQLARQRVIAGASFGARHRFGNAGVGAEQHQRACHAGTPHRRIQRQASAHGVADQHRRCRQARARLFQPARCAGKPVRRGARHRRRRTVAGQFEAIARDVRANQVVQLVPVRRLTEKAVHEQERRTCRRRHRHRG